MSLRPKRGITGLKTCPHGGIDHGELKALGLKTDEVLDFSVCTNPFMPPPGIREAMGSIAIDQYPDCEATEFREELSAHLGTPMENILAGNGTTELIRLIASAYFRRGERVLILEPTYGEYETACLIAGTRLVRHRAKGEDNFRPKMEDVAETISKHQPGGVFICNPNNPTGKYLSRREIEQVLGAIGDGLLVLDEAYIDFIEESWNSLDLIERDNVVVLRSMTKNFGLPGLRLGYAVANQVIIDALRRVRPPWNVNIIAQKAGTIALKNREYLERSLGQTREAKHYLTGELGRLGYQVLPSDAHYFLMRTGNAREFRHSLLKRGIMVRDCASLGLPEYVRISPRTLPECRKLIEAITRI